VASLSAAEFRCHKCRLAAERQANSAAGFSLTKFILKADIVIDIIALNGYIGGSSISARGAWGTARKPEGWRQSGPRPRPLGDARVFWSQSSLLGLAGGWIQDQPAGALAAVIKVEQVRQRTRELVIGSAANSACAPIVLDEA